MAFDQVGEDFGIGLARERVAFADQFGAQRGVVLDDPVVDDGEFPRAVQVRVRVFIRRAAVGGPARVADADVAVQRLRRSPAARPGARVSPRPSNRRVRRHRRSPRFRRESYPRYSKRPQRIHNDRNAVALADITRRCRTWLLEGAKVRWGYLIPSRVRW